jgi:NitT/TauT family transport system substrate-binding protein
MKRLLTGIFAAALLVGCAPSGQNNDSSGNEGASNTAPGPKETVTFTLNWVPYGEHAPFYYGIQKGYYADEGIDLKIEPGSGSGNTIKAVAQGQTMFGWADTPPMLKAVSTGMPVKSLGVFLQKGPASIEFLAEKNIKSIKDLKGKTVGGTPGDAMYASFPALLAANDMQPSDVTVVNMDPANKIAQLAAGQVDAIMGFFHDQGPTIENKTGKKVDHLLFADSGLNMLGLGIVASDETLSGKKDLVGKFVRATQKSWAEAAKHPEDAAKVMVDMAENEPPEEVLVKQLTLAIPLLQLKTAGEPGVNTEDQWSDTIDIMSKNAGLTDAGDPSKYWDGSFAKGSGS